MRIRPAASCKRIALVRTRRRGPLIGDFRPEIIDFASRHELGIIAKRKGLRFPA
jgi:hypothetical protein